MGMDKVSLTVIADHISVLASFSTAFGAHTGIATLPLVWYGTEEQKQRQRERIQEWRPWEKSTGPRSIEGKQASSRNAYTGGLWLELRELSKKTTLLIRQLKAQGDWPPRQGTYRNL